MWAIASRDLIQDLLCARLQCYGPNVVLLHCGVPLLLNYLPVWSFSQCFRNASHYITSHLQFASNHKWPSVPHVELQESARCKYKMLHVWVTKSMDAATARDHRSRCSQHLQLQLPQPLYMIHFCSSCSQLIWNDHVSFWIGDGGRQVCRTAERSGIASDAGCGVGYDTTCSQCHCCSAGCWCASTACTRHGGWSRYWQSLCSGHGSGSYMLSDICNVRIVQRRCEGGVLTLECRGYETPCLRGIPLTSRYGNATVNCGKSRIHQMPTLLLMLTIS